jgi:hypothetical protein
MRHLNPMLIALALLLSACGGGDPPGSEGPQPLAIANTSLPDAKTGTTYAGHLFIASGGTAPFSWSTDAAVPMGMYVDSNGAFVGTPAIAGDFTFKVLASDSSTIAQTATLTVTIKIADSPIVVDPSQAPPAAVHNVAYSGFTFGATGGSWPYTSMRMAR